MISPETRKIISNGKKNAKDLVISIHNQRCEVTVAGRKESIIECAALVRDPENVCTVYEVDNFYLSCNYNYEKEDWKAFVHIYELAYNISHKKSYNSDFSLILYAKSVSFVTVVAMTRPTLYNVPVSGLFVEIGIRGMNYNRTIEVASALIQLISDKPTREMLEKERANEKSQHYVDVMDCSDIDTDDLDNYITEDEYCDDNNYDMEEEDYE